MSTKSQSDALVAFVFLRRLLTLVKDTQAYKLGLVDSSGKVRRFPKTGEEVDSLTVLDQVAFKMRRLLGTKMSQLNKLLYLVNMADNSMNRLNSPNFDKEELERLKREINSLGESEKRDIISVCETIVAEGGNMKTLRKRVKFKDSYVYKNYDFDHMNKALFEYMRARNTEKSYSKDKYLKMTDAELEESGFYSKYPHLR